MFDKDNLASVLSEFGKVYFIEDDKHAYAEDRPMREHVFNHLSCAPNVEDTLRRKIRDVLDHNELTGDQPLTYRAPSYTVIGDKTMVSCYVGFAIN